MKNSDRASHVIPESAAPREAKGRSGEPDSAVAKAMADKQARDDDGHASIVNQAEIFKLANLARIAITDDEAQAAASNLSGILENFAAIRSIDTDVSGLPAGRQDLRNVMREDVARDGVLADPEELLRNAKTKNGYIEVSAVFAEQSVP